MKGLSDAKALASMPSVAPWLRHSQAAHLIVCEAYPEDLDPKAHARALGLETVVLQLNHLRTHPSVAGGLAKGDSPREIRQRVLAEGDLRLHGWFFEIQGGEVLACDGEASRFISLEEGEELPVALAPSGPISAAVLALRRGPAAGGVLAPPHVTGVAALGSGGASAPSFHDTE